MGGSLVLAKSSPVFEERFILEGGIREEFMSSEIDKMDLASSTILVLLFTTAES